MRQEVFSVLLSASLLLPCFQTKTANYNNLLARVSAQYGSLSTFFLEGREETVVDGTDCKAEFAFQIARQRPSDKRSPFAGSITGIHFLTPRLSTACRETIKSLGQLPSAGEWIDFNSIELGIKAIHELPTQMLELGSGEKIACVVLEVIYDDYHENIRLLSGPIRYWIDPSTNLIRRVQFTQRIERGLMSSTATIHSIVVGGPTPLWLEIPSDTANQSVEIGRPAPDFILRDAKGQLIHLSEMRGKIVLLSFWATWCLACDEEVPTLEKIQANNGSGSDVVLLGVTSESGKVVRRWLRKNRRSFDTVVDAKEVYESYGIRELPALVVIDRNGCVAAEERGFIPELHFTPILRKLTCSPARP